MPINEKIVDQKGLYLKCSGIVNDAGTFASLNL